MSPVRKIRFVKNQLLYVGDIIVQVKRGNKYENLEIDRSKATSSSVFTYCKQNGWFRKCETFEATKNPSVTGFNDGTWTIDLAASYENIYVKCYTNAQKIELLAENDGVLESYDICPSCPSFSVDTNAHPVTNSNLWLANWQEYYSEVIEPIITINCIKEAHWSGHVQACVKGTNSNSCSGFTPFVAINKPYRSLVQQFNNNGQAYYYKMIDETPCGYDTLPGGLQVSDKKQDGCFVRYEKCIGDNCLKRPDGTTFYQEQILGCMDGRLSEWSPWKCTNGESIRKRECIQPLSGGKPCPNEPLVEKTTCSDGKPSEWSAWVCDGKTAKSTRTCEQPVNGGAPCPELERFNECSHGKLTEWGSFVCDGEKSKKTRSCIQPTFGGNPCPNEPLEESHECSHGKLTEWSKWSECNNKSKSRKRSCIQPTFGGNPCPSEPLEETEKCSNGQLTEWSNWECKGLKSKRTRSCNPPVNGGKPCPNEPLEETKECVDTNITIILILILLCLLSSSSAFMYINLN
jgi:hypothetical protein